MPYQIRYVNLLDMLMTYTLADGKHGVLQCKRDLPTTLTEKDKETHLQAAMCPHYTCYNNNNYHLQFFPLEGKKSNLTYMK